MERERTFNKLKGFLGLRPRSEGGRYNGPRRKKRSGGKSERGKVRASDLWEGGGTNFGLVSNSGARDGRIAAGGWQVKNTYDLLAKRRGRTDKGLN